MTTPRSSPGWPAPGTSRASALWRRRILSGSTHYDILVELNLLMSVREFLAPIFRRRWLLLGILPLWIVPFSLLRTLERDGREIFAAQKNALILEVYSRTDLPSDAYPLLEESLTALPDVKEV